MNMPTPPQVPGKPLLGNLLEFRRDPNALLRHGYATLGPIFAIRLGPKPVAVLVGPEYHRFFFQSTDTILAMDKPYKFLKPMFGDTGFTAGPETYRQQRPVFTSPLQAKKMENYVQVMADEVQTWFKQLGDAGQFDLVSTFEMLTQHVAARSFMGDDFYHQLSNEFWALYKDLAGGIDFILPPNLPLPRFLRRNRARRRMEAMLRPIITERRAHPERYTDFLQDFVSTPLLDNTPTSDELIVNMVLGLIFAGHETTASQGSWSLIQLLQNHDYLKLVAAELDVLLPPGATINLGVLRQMKHLEWALKETERTHPIAEFILRYTNSDYELGGYMVPQGWLTMLTPTIAHRLPELFAEPDRYDPLRFAPGREEDRQHHFALIGFGGGLHKCTGMNFAMNEMKVIIGMLIQRYELTLANPNPRPARRLGATRPESPCWIRYRRRSIPLQPSIALEAGNSACPHMQQSAACPVSSEQRV